MKKILFLFTFCLLMPFGIQAQFHAQVDLGSITDALARFDPGYYRVHFSNGDSLDVKKNENFLVETVAYGSGVALSSSKVAAPALATELTFEVASVTALVVALGEVAVPAVIAGSLMFAGTLPAYFELEEITQKAQEIRSQNQLNIDFSAFSFYFLGATDMPDFLRRLTGESYSREKADDFATWVLTIEGMRQETQDDDEEVNWKDMSFDLESWIYQAQKNQVFGNKPTDPERAAWALLTALAFYGNSPDNFERLENWIITQYGQGIVSEVQKIFQMYKSGWRGMPVSVVQGDANSVVNPTKLRHYAIRLLNAGNQTTTGNYDRFDCYFPNYSIKVRIDSVFRGEINFTFPVINLAGDTIPVKLDILIGPYGRSGQTYLVYSQRGHERLPKDLGLEVQNFIVYYLKINKRQTEIPLFRDY